MNKIILILALLIKVSPLYGQTAENFYDKSLELAKDGKLEEAIPVMTESIQLDSSVASSWYFRGLMYMQTGYPEKAIPDFEKAEMLEMRTAKLYLNKALSKRGVTDYDGALGDLNLAIALDKESGIAFYHRAALHLLLGARDSACADFKIAAALGVKQAEHQVERCRESPGEKIYPILRLTKSSTDKKYGFDEKKLIKVGTGPDGGPANQKAYLNLLRDMNGRPISYERAGSCCSYKSENALIGDVALADRYIITYTDEQGKKQEKAIHISFYDYEEPQIPYGFTTVKPVNDTRK